jgi:putative hydrolase of the HAD superfamily
VAYSGLILDFGGVVTTDFYGALSAFCVREGLAPDAITNAIRTSEGRETLAGAETGQLPQRAWEIALGELLGLSDQGLLQRALGDLRPRPEIVTLVRDARRAGIRTAILSNSWGQGDYDPYTGYGLEEDYDAIVISDQVGLRKPQPEIYTLTLSKLGLPADECVFVDDSPANLPTAHELGMATVHFRGADQIPEIRELIGLG